jgi:putative peptide zinc metalloprotease protein
MLTAKNWQTLANLHPNLPAHIDIQERYYGDELWYLLQDKSNGRFHRFSPTGYCLIALMDGQRNLQQILQAAQASHKTSHKFSDEELPPPSREELIELLQYLYVADLLVCDIPADSQELFQRQQRHKQQKWRRLLLNPLVWKIPLGDPDKFLNRLQPISRYFTHWAAALIWLLFVSYALLLSIGHWNELTNAALNQVLVPQNMIWLWLTYPLLKILHELGHGLYTKAWGGEVHECGIVVMMGIPLPYVDASAATGFPRKRQRLMVGAAGMAVELFLAALALILWLQLEDGQLKTLAFNIIVLGSVSTLFFNGNPLMRFDGYHLLCDALDAPNLGSRANQQIGYSIQRYGYGIQDVASPSSSVQGSIGFFMYGVLAFLYRLLILAGIIMLVWQHFPTLGATLAIWLIIFQIVLPLGKLVLFIAKSPRLQPQRRRALVATLTTLAGAFIFIFYIPMPLSTRAEGVTWLPDNAQVRVESNGFVNEILVKEGDWVIPGQLLILTDNPKLKADLALKKTELQEHQARYHSVWSDDQAQAKLIVEDIHALEAEIHLLQTRVKDLSIYSKVAGQVIFANAYDLQDRFLQQGEAIAFISQPGPAQVRVAVTQHEMGLVLNHTRLIEAKLSRDLSKTLHGTLERQVPAATQYLPSAALGSGGGGRIAVTARQDNNMLANELIFLLDISLPILDQQGQYGERVYVRFKHPPEPWGKQAYRTLQQLFLKTLQR